RECAWLRATDAAERTTERAPSAHRPPALVCLPPLVRPSSRPFDGLQPAHIALQHIRHRDRAALLLIGLHHRAERARDGDAGDVERVDVAVLTTVLGAIARIHAPRLELAAERTGRNLAVHVLSGQPHFDVVRLLGGKAHVAGAERDHAVVQIEPAQNFLGAGEHALVLVPALFGRGDGDEFDLVELMLADHAASILTLGARLGTETR